MRDRRRESCWGLCPKGERLIDESQEGPRSHSERFCTDAICLLPLLTTISLLAAIGQLALATGDPNSLRFGTDHLGRRCGAGPLAAAPKLYYPHLGSELLAQRELLSTPWQLQLFGVCVAECPQRDSGAVREVGSRSEAYAVSLSTQSVMNRCLPVEEQDTVQSVYCVEPSCHAVGLTCKAVHGHSGAWLMRGGAQQAKCTRQLSMFVQETYSLPGPAETLLVHLAAAVGGAGSAAAAVAAARGEVLVCGLLLAVAVGLVWLLFLRCCARCAVYLLLGSTLLLLLLATALCSVKAGALSTAQLDAISAHAAGAMDAYQRSDYGASVSAAQAAQAAQLGHAVTEGLAVSEADAAYFTWGAALLGVACVCYGALLLALRKQISTVVAIVTEATVAVGAMPALLPFPLATLAAQLAVYGYAVVVASYLLTSVPTVADVASLEGRWEDTIEGAVNATLSQLGRLPSQPLGQPHLDQATVKLHGAALLPELNPEHLRTGLLLFHIFGVLWLAQLVQAIGYAAMSGAVSHWFFFRDQPSERQRLPVVGSLWRAVRFHLGSLAFGALLVALVQLVRLIFEWVDQQTKRLQQGSETAKVAIKCTRCCLWCLEKCLQFITGYAYIFVALNGDSFCTAAHDTLRLLTAYPATALLSHYVQSLLFAVQSLLLPVLCALAAFRLVERNALPDWLQTAQAAADDATHKASDGVVAAFDLGGEGRARVEAVAGGVAGAVDACVTWLGRSERGADEEVDPVWPALATLLLAYFVARAFASVYECVVDTLFVCAMRDREEYGGAHMSAALRDAIGLAEPKEKAAPNQAEGGDSRHV